MKQFRTMLRTLTAIAVLTLSLMTLSAPFLSTVYAGSGFDEEDVDGSYGFDFSGVQIVNGQQIPVTIVGVFESDGDGSLVSVERTVNLGGQILTQVGSGVYTVNTNGVVTASVTVSTIDPPGLPETTGSFEGVLTEKKDRTMPYHALEAEGTIFVGSGVARQQR